MIDFRDPFKPDLKSTIKPKNNSSGKLNNYQNNQSQVERIYINKNVAMNMQKGSSRGKKTSHSENYRRVNTPSDTFLGSNFDFSKTLL